VPKIVDHDRRREEIAVVACHVIATYGFEQATVARIADAAGFTTGMVAHYFDTKQDIILAALRLILHRMERRLTRSVPAAESDLLEVLSVALPIDSPRRTECAFWVAFWGQVSADKRLNRLNTSVHREYLRLYEKCIVDHWPEARRWSPAVRRQALQSITAFINGITASAVSSPSDWPPREQVRQLRLQLELVRAWALQTARLSPT
jgi:TetR/AcrR family transcriptional regulator, transcriptional repressor of bet genes